jgi:hypothetical protein
MPKSRAGIDKRRIVLGCEVAQASDAHPAETHQVHDVQRLDYAAMRPKLHNRGRELGQRMSLAVRAAARAGRINIRKVVDVGSAVGDAQVQVVAQPNEPGTNGRLIVDREAPRFRGVELGP